MSNRYKTNKIAFFLFFLLFPMIYAFFSEESIFKMDLMICWAFFLVMPLYVYAGSIGLGGKTLESRLSLIFSVIIGISFFIKSCIYLYKNHSLWLTILLSIILILVIIGFFITLHDQLIFKENFPFIFFLVPLIYYIVYDFWNFIFESPIVSIILCNISMSIFLFFYKEFNKNQYLKPIISILFILNFFVYFILSLLDFIQLFQSYDELISWIVIFIIFIIKSTFSFLFFIGIMSDLNIYNGKINKIKDIIYYIVLYVFFELIIKNNYSYIYLEKAINGEILYILYLIVSYMIFACMAVYFLSLIIKGSDYFHGVIIENNLPNIFEAYYYISLNEISNELNQQTEEYIKQDILSNTLDKFSVNRNNDIESLKYRDELRKYQKDLFGFCLKISSNTYSSLKIPNLIIEFFKKNDAVILSELQDFIEKREKLIRENILTMIIETLNLYKEKASLNGGGILYKSSIFDKYEHTSNIITIDGGYID